MWIQIILLMIFPTISIFFIIIDLILLKKEKNMRVAIAGINGRMGEYIYNILSNRTGFNLVCGIAKDTQKYKDLKIYNDFEEAILNEKIDLMIDFTNAESFRELCELCLNSNIKFISGTTGLGGNDISDMINLSTNNNTTFVHIPNFAKGASEVYKLLTEVKDTYENIEVIEIHHKSKVDKPSGTAKEYSKALLLNEDKIESIREDDVIASHSIIFTNPGEKLTIKHEINHRDAFLSGFVNVLNEVRRKKYLLIVGLNDFYKL